MTARKIVISMCAVALVAAFVLWSVSKGDVSGSLAEVSPGVEMESHRVGEFVVLFSDGSDGTSLSIAHRSRPERVLWQSVPGRSFVSAGRGEETVSNSRGHFTIEDETLESLPDQSIESIEDMGDELVISGGLSNGGEEETNYSFALSPASDGRLRFVAEVEEPFNRVYLTYATSPEERFFGFGTQYTYFDLKGRKVPIFIQEQGIGRGAQPVTLGANLQAGAGGSWHSTYAAVPHYITSKSRSLFLENHEYSSFDLRDEDEIHIEVFSSEMTGQILAADTPAGLIEEYTEYSGRMRPLPDWLLSGAVVGMQGGTGRVREVREELEMLDAPISAFWLQDWVGRRQTSFGSQLWWNWELDTSRYPGWNELVADLEDDGMRVMMYISPMLADAAEKPGVRRNLFEEAKERGYLVEDESGEPYMMRQTDFSAAMVDLTNPEAREWMK
ncbi:MAG: TIM-barrel domain-containing protein, partial [Rubrobacteraceae bacterium]